MARASGPTFIVELPLVVPARDEREMLLRLELARQLYNACLGEALARLARLRSSPDYAAALALPKTVQGKPNAERAAALAALRKAHGLTSEAISAFGTRCKNEAGWNAGRDRTDPRLGAHETQRIAERAFAAVQMYALGRRGRPRFKSKTRALHSLEGKSAGSSLRWSAEIGCLRWGALCLRAKMPPAGRDAWLEEALRAPTKFARIVWRIIKGRRRWFVQLAQAGLPPLKYETAPSAVVGLDVGPSTVALYSERAAGLLPLAPEIQQPWQEMRRLQRAMDRSRRATNPHCFNADGTFKRGERLTVRSRGYERLRCALAETERVLAARRKRSHGRLANKIIGCGNVLQAEDLSYRAFQRRFGRSSKIRASGSFMALLARKAARAGGEFRGLDAWSLKLSQYDHTTGTCTKKRLSQRWHVLGDGSGVVQRDVYSAFLAAVSDTAAIHPSRAEEVWPAAKLLLGRAGWMRQEPASVASLLAAAGADGGLPQPERVARQRALACGDVPNQPGRAAGDGPRTPWL